MYIRYCRDNKIKPHPARFPVELPEYFIRMLTDTEDLVVDPFAGSCVTGEAAEKTKRNWICCEIVPEYVEGALGRFQHGRKTAYRMTKDSESQSDNFYKAFKPGFMWNGADEGLLPKDGGAKRVMRTLKSSANKYRTAEGKPTQMKLLESRKAYGTKQRSVKKAGLD
jgi:site-specific DNA-methyltransferase (cytosine-N4-specific)